MFTCETHVEHGALAWFLRTATSRPWRGARGPLTHSNTSPWKIVHRMVGIHMFPKLSWKKDYLVGQGRAEGGQIGGI